MKKLGFILLLIAISSLLSLSVLASDLTLEIISDTPEFVSTGDIIEIEVILHNSSSTALQSVQITNSQDREWSQVVSVPARDSRSIQYRYIVGSRDIGGSALQFKFFASNSAYTAVALATGSDSVEYTVIPDRVLSFAGSNSPTNNYPIQLGTEIKYDFRLTNLGNAPIHNIVVSSTLDPSLYTTINMLDAGGDRVVSLNYVVPQSTPDGDLNHRFMMTAEDIETSYTTVLTPVVGKKDLEISAALSNSNPLPGTRVIATIYLKNVGTVPLRSLNVTCSLDPSWSSNISLISAGSTVMETFSYTVPLTMQNGDIIEFIFNVSDSGNILESTVISNPITGTVSTNTDRDPIIHTNIQPEDGELEVEMGNDNPFSGNTGTTNFDPRDDVIDNTQNTDRPGNSPSSTLPDGNPIDNNPPWVNDFVRDMNSGRDWETILKNIPDGTPIEEVIPYIPSDLSPEVLRGLLPGWATPFIVAHGEGYDAGDVFGDIIRGGGLNDLMDNVASLDHYSSALMDLIFSDIYDSLVDEDGNMSPDILSALTELDVDNLSSSPTSSVDTSSGSDTSDSHNQSNLSTIDDPSIPAPIPTPRSSSDGVLPQTNDSTHNINYVFISIALVLLLILIKTIFSLAFGSKQYKQSVSK